MPNSMIYKKGTILFGIALLLLGVFDPEVAMSEISEGGPLLFSADTKEEILAWYRSRGAGFVPYYSPFEHAGEKVLVVLPQKGSGILTTDIVVYLYYPPPYSGWSLILLRPTSVFSVHAEIDEEKNMLVFRSAKGKILVLLPFETLGLSEGPDKYLKDITIPGRKSLEEDDLYRYSE